MGGETTKERSVGDRFAGVGRWIGNHVFNRKTEGSWWNRAFNGGKAAASMKAAPKPTTSATSPILENARTNGHARARRREMSGSGEAGYGGRFDQTSKAARDNNGSTQGLAAQDRAIDNGEMDGIYKLFDRLTGNDEKNDEETLEEMLKEWLRVGNAGLRGDKKGAGTSDMIDVMLAGSQKASREQAPGDDLTLLTGNFGLRIGNVLGAGALIGEGNESMEEFARKHPLVQRVQAKMGDLARIARGKTTNAADEEYSVEQLKQFAPHIGAMQQFQEGLLERAMKKGWGTGDREIKDERLQRLYQTSEAAQPTAASPLHRMTNTLPATTVVPPTKFNLPAIDMTKAQNALRAKQGLVPLFPSNSWRRQSGAPSAPTETPALRESFREQ